MIYHDTTQSNDKTRVQLSTIINGTTIGTEFTFTDDTDIGEIIDATVRAYGMLMRQLLQYYTERFP